MSRTQRKLLSLPLVVLVSCLLAPSSYAQDIDTTPPELTAFDFVPKNIDVTSSSQDVTVTLDLTDDLSGALGAYITFESPTGIQNRLGFAFNRIAGNALNGTYEGTITFLPFIESGIWTVRYVQVVDAVGNWGTLASAVLVAAGFPTQLFVVSNQDVTGPTLEGVTVTPGAVDVSGGASTATIELTARDNLSGVTFDPPFTAFFAVVFESPTGIQQQFVANRQFVLDSGTTANGTWTATAPFLRYSEAGEWRISQVWLEDAAGNSTFLGHSELVALGLDRVLQVASVPADTTPPSLVRMQLIPTVIDTASSAQNVRVRMTMTDNLAGVDFSLDTPYISYLFGPTYTSPSAGQQWSVGNFFPQLQLVAGDALNGIWEATVTVPRFSEAGTWRVDYVHLKDAARNITFLTRDDLDGTGIADDLVVIRPSLVGDGTIGPGGGTVTDDTFGDRASVTIPAGALSARTTQVAIDVFEEPLDVPMPQGFSAPGTRFVNIDLNPEPAFPLPAPGMTVVLPLVDFAVPGAPLALFRIEPSTGQLVPSLDGSGSPIIGTVDSGGLSATFTGVVHLSTVVGLVPKAPDTAAPTIVCAQADTLWHAANVTLTCTAQDGDSGLANSGDASFGLSTSVAAGQEQSNALTNTRQVCDVAGNCATAGPIGGNMIDRKAPGVTPPANQTAVQTEPGGAVVTYPAATFTDGGSGITSASCSPASSLFPLGVTTVTCTAVDGVGNTGTATFTVTVTPATGGVEGRMHGAGQIAEGSTHHHFVFRVVESNAREYGRLEYWVSESRFCSRDDHAHERDGNRNGGDDREYGRGHGRASSHFEVTAIASVVFSNDPAFRPGRGTRPGLPTVDSVSFTGAGKWNGQRGYKFEATVTDRGEPGRGRDTFSLVIRDAAGNVVAQVSDSLDGGNIQSDRLRR